MREYYGRVGADQWHELLPNRSCDAIKTKAREIKIARRNQVNKWTLEEDQVLREHYGHSGYKVMHELLPGRLRNEIKGRAVKLGLKGDRSKSIKQYEVDTLFFREANLLNSYWAGFIAADGCLLPNGNRVSFNLAARDIAHLENFIADSKYTGKVFLRTSTTSVLENARFAYLSISGVPQWLEDLNTNFNITPRKSLTLQPPAGLTFEQSLAFIIGYLDGDGTIFEGNYKSLGKVYPTMCVGFLGTFDMLTWIKNIFDEMVTPKRIAHVVKRGNIHAYNVVGTRAKSILSVLKNIDVPKLPRKWDKVTW